MKRREPPVRAKLSYREQRELEELPARIDVLEAERRDLSERSAREDFYREAPSTINATLARIAEIGVEVDSLYVRWDLLDSRPK